MFHLKITINSQQDYHEDNRDDSCLGHCIQGTLIRVRKRTCRSTIEECRTIIVK